MSKDDGNGVIEATLAALTEQLADAGFDTPPDVQRATIDRLVRWSRGAGWKRDVVQVSHRLKQPSRVTVSVSVYLPCRAEKELLLDGRSVERAVGREKGYWVPRFLAEVRAGAFARGVATDTVKALGWFDRYYSTPADALSRLKGGDTNYGTGGGRAYEDLVVYLSALAGVTPQRD